MKYNLGKKYYEYEKEIRQSHGFKWMKATDYYATHTYKNPPLLNKNEGLNKN